MNRRQMIGTLGLGAAGAATASLAQARQQGHDHGAEHDGHLETLAQCARICNEVAHHSLEKLCSEAEASTRESLARIHEATMDCQAFCVLTATLMARHSPMSHHAHAACAEACTQCANVCKESGVDSEEIKKCIEICEKCAKHCREMAKTPHEHHHHEDH